MDGILSLPEKSGDGKTTDEEKASKEEDDSKVNEEIDISDEEDDEEEDEEPPSRSVCRICNNNPRTTIITRSFNSLKMSG